MKLARPLIVSLAIVSFSTASFAGDLRESIAKAAQPQEEKRPARPMPKGYLVSGAALFVAGMSMAIYGFLHTNGGEFVSGEVSKESNTALGAAGLAVAGAGGAVLFLGVKRAAKAPSVTFGPGHVAVSKRVSW
jgi:hypothetical protein